MTCRRGLADRDFLAVLAPARVERALRVEASISVGTEIVAQGLQQIGRAARPEPAVQSCMAEGLPRINDRTLCPYLRPV